MSKVSKLLSETRNNPHNWRIEDLMVIAKHFNIKHRQPGTSHVTFSKGPFRVTVPSHKPIKPVYIKHFLEMIDEILEEDKHE